MTGGVRTLHSARMKTMWSRAAVLRGLRGGVVVLCGALALAGCRSVDAKVWNLRQVHESDGSTKRMGRLHNDMQHRMIQGTQIADLQKANIFGLQEGKEKPIEDPDGVSLENLIELGEFDADDPRVLALQVEMFGWLGVDDRYALARERAQLELGSLGRRLGVETPMRPPADPPPAGADEVGAALQDLIAIVIPAVRGVAPVAARDIEEGCAAIDALVLERNGLRRLIGAITVLLYDGKAPPEALGVLPELHRSLMRTFLAQSLSAGLDDSSPRVRAAALESAVLASDNALPDLLVGALARDPTEEVKLRCLHLLEKHGFPRIPPEVSAEDAARFEENLLALLVEILRSPFESSVTIAACRTMGELSGAPIASLHPEVWLAWWDEAHPGGSS